MGSLGSLCRHRHVSLPSPGANGRQISITLITYHVITFVRLTSGLWDSCSLPSSPLSHLGFWLPEQSQFFPLSACVLLTTVCMSVGDGHSVSLLCTAYLLSSLSPALDARRKFMHLQFSKLTTSIRMYDRGVKNLPPRQTGGLRHRIETLVGITGVKMAKYRVTWYEAVTSPFKLVWRPHLLSILVFEVLTST
jgi:hypothetical protein